MVEVVAVVPVERESAKKSAVGDSTSLFVKVPSMFNVNYGSSSDNIDLGRPNAVIHLFIAFSADNTLTHVVETNIT